VRFGFRRKGVDAWLDDVRSGWGERAYRSAVAISPALAPDQALDLHAVGLALATDGHSLEDVLAWFALLAARSSRHVGRHLLDGGITELASGWADGLLSHDFDLSGIAPFEVLRLRLRQQVELARSLGEQPGRHLAIVVIETDGSSIATSAAARHARNVFDTGETIAFAPSGKLLVLAQREHDVRSRTVRLSAALREDAQIGTRPIRVWIEPLAMSADHVDSHLLGLAS